MSVGLRLSASILLCVVGAGAVFSEVQGVVLRVNDRIATLYDFQQRYSDRVAAVSGSELEPDRRSELLGEAGRDTFCELFRELLVLSRADQLSLEVTEPMVDGAVANARQSYGFADEQSFYQALERSGRSVRSFREQMRRTMLIQQVMRNQLSERAALEEEDLRRYYQTHLEDFRVDQRLRLRETVVLEASDATPEERTAIADEIAVAAAGGDSLEDALGDYVDQGIATGVIDLGWVAAGDLEPSLESAVWDLEEGSIAGPVHGRGGLHVLRVEEVQPARVLDFADVRDRIEELETQRVLAQASGRFMEELAEASYIVESPPAEAAGYRVGCLTSIGQGPDLAPPSTGSS